MVHADVWQNEAHDRGLGSQLNGGIPKPPARGLF